MSQQNEFWVVVQGILLLIGMHIVAGVFIFVLGIVLQQILGGYILIGIWVIGLAAISLGQLLYVIPVCIWLRRKRKPLMMKGVIIGAVITALINGACFLLIRG